MPSAYWCGLPPSRRSGANIVQRFAGAHMAQHLRALLDSTPLDGDVGAHSAAAPGHLHQERGRGGLVGDRQAGKGTVGVRCMAYIPLATCTPLISGVRSDSASSFFKARR